MIERIEMAVGFAVLAAALSVSAVVAVGGGGFADQVNGAVPFLGGERPGTHGLERAAEAQNQHDGTDSTDGQEADEDAQPPEGAGDGATVAGDGDPGCVEALAEAQSRTELGEHVADPAMPAGGVDGNENALDKQCGGAFAPEPEAAPTPEEAPPSDPGKSEQAPATPEAGGQAGGPGQANADSSGSGAAEAPGQNKQ